MEAFAKVVGVIVFTALIACAYALLLAYPTKWLVNDLFTPATINSLFGVAQLDFWRALYLSLLCGLLFKGSSSSSSKD